MVGGDPIWLNDDPDDDPMCPGEPIWPWGSPNPPPSTQSGSIDRPMCLYIVCIQNIYIYISRRARDAAISVIYLCVDLCIYI